ncbi:hypothetical protein AVEN_86301-1 [Araneus ventricosus]|uniref:Uncharacterized protein n=1 Tax=Araneus ventricosus TaxID=182803 RepID=A0A4Y2H5F9_ARAVE|nr:hypothetical protein AVEN_86301-1 [Araneus ventricosus]
MVVESITSHFPKHFQTKSAFFSSHKPSLPARISAPGEQRLTKAERNSKYLPINAVGHVHSSVVNRDTDAARASVDWTSAARLTTPTDV